MAQEPLIVFGHDLTNAPRYAYPGFEDHPEEDTIVCPRCGRYLSPRDLDPLTRQDDGWTCESFYNTGSSEMWIMDIERRADQGSVIRRDGHSGQLPAFMITRLY